MYYIYHIPGIKVGCTENPNNRIKQQTKSDWEILEIHTDIDIASKRELELQKQGLIKQAHTIVEAFTHNEKILIEKYGADSVINMQTGEVTQTEKEKNE